MSAAIEIRNRIVSFDPAVAPDQLLANPGNHRRHPAAQQAALRGSLKDLGWVDVVKVNVRTSHVCDGHARIEESLRQGSTVPVLYLDLSEDEERLMLATHDQITLMAVHDQGALDLLLKDIATAGTATDSALKALLASMASPGVLDKPVEDEDAVPEPPAEPITKPGDLIVLGEHRLICGDSKDPGVWERLLGDERADLVWTDPPYGVNMEEKNEAQARVSGRANSQQGRGIANDDLAPEALEGFLRDVLALAFAFTRPGGVWYVAGPLGPNMLPFGKVLSEIEVWRQTLLWIKNSLVLGRSDYHYRAEVLFYGWKPGAAHRRLEDRTQDNVWEIDRPSKSADHPTMKPVALVERALNNSSVAGEIVVDPFGGSGTTLIACEKTNRKARLIEISPVYCDVIARRYEQATGKQAERVSPEA